MPAISNDANEIVRLIFDKSAPGCILSLRMTIVNDYIIGDPLGVILSIVINKAE